jgi:hypothetical protein
VLGCLQDVHLRHPFGKTKRRCLKPIWNVIIGISRGTPQHCLNERSTAQEVSCQQGPADNICVVKRGERVLVY